MLVLSNSNLIATFVTAKDKIVTMARPISAETANKVTLHVNGGYRYASTRPRVANEATGIFLQCDRHYFNEETRALLDAGINPLVFPGLHTTVSSEESKLINLSRESKVIISASGMCEAEAVHRQARTTRTGSMVRRGFWSRLPTRPASARTLRRSLMATRTWLMTS